MRLPAQGGPPETVARVEAGEVADGPTILPDGEHLLFTIALGTGPDRWDRGRIVAESLRSHQRTTIVTGGSHARYLPSGHLTYAVAGVLYAVPFDAANLTVSGTPVAVIEGVARTAFPGTSSGNARVAIADAGTMVYIPGPKASTVAESGVGWFDRTGGAEPIAIQRGPWEQPRRSPDGARLAMDAYDGKSAGIWIYELSGASSVGRLTLEGQGNNRYPVWSEDSQRVAFQSDREGDTGVFWPLADGTRPAERLTTAPAGVAHVPGRTRSAVFVEPFPSTGAKYHVSANAGEGFHPAWSPDGRHLFYYVPGPGQTVNQVAVTTSSGFVFSDPVQVSMPFVSRSPAAGRQYDVGRDGRFLALTQERDAAGSREYHVVVNWFEELTRRVPAIRP
jgi:hypothetical protein